jgi:hypothetical protein
MLAAFLAVKGGVVLAVDEGTLKRRRNSLGRFPLLFLGFFIILTLFVFSVGYIILK